MKLQKEKGITLVALVVTIVVLLILAGVSINLVLGENGLITQAQEAKRKTEEATQNEMAGIDNLSKEIERYSFEGGSWNEALGLCTPKLGTNMVGAYWSDGTKNDSGLYVASETLTNVEVTSDQAEFSWAEWYNYRAETTEKLDSKKSRWANAKSLVDGSYFVWIPRYEYKILSGEHTATAGKIDVEFISTNVTEPTKEGYKVHPAFTTNLQLGGWDKDISGIWVAKYEMSMEETTDGGKTWSNTEVTSETGDKTISNTVRAVSKPSQYSWSWINISNCFTNSLNYSSMQLTGKNSHLMKNSEWGAVAYLTHSKYGRNENSMTINSYAENEGTYTKITGIGGKLKESQYNTEQGMDASTTGNIYGIYDLNGGNAEYIAILYSKYTNMYVTPMNANTLNNKYSIDDKASQLPANSSKYITIYPMDMTDNAADGSINIYYTKWKEIYGDAVFETSEKCGNSNSSWLGERSDEDSGTGEYACIRGGWAYDGETAGIFAFGDGDGSAWYAFGYRISMACE